MFNIYSSQHSVFEQTMKTPESDQIQTEVRRLVNPPHVLHATAVRQAEKKMKRDGIKGK